MSDRAGFGDYEREWLGGTRARVFISCGQTDPEMTDADAIARIVWDAGYCPYVARRSRSPEGMKEAIFRRLSSAEYFLFVDFPREGLVDLRKKPGGSGPVLPDKTRGSLFSHQELAVASFLNLPILPFQHSSVGREGILGVIQGNASRFADSPDLLSKVEAEVKQSGWPKNWRNELTVGVNPGPTGPVIHPSLGESLYFHLNLKNSHYSRTASDCRVFAERVRSPTDNDWRPLPPVEMKYRYLRPESGTIVPGQTRQTDAALVPVLHPDLAYIGFNAFLVDEGSIPSQFQLRGVGDHRILFSVYSREFPPTHIETILTLASSISQVTFVVAPPKP